MAPPWILLFLDRAAKWPEDNDLDKKLQRKFGLDAIPPKANARERWHPVSHQAGDVDAEA
jgi:hypothetical protein